MKYVAYAALAVLLLAGGFAARIAYGPVSVNSFAPYLQSTMSRAFGGAAVDFDSAVLSWAGEGGALELRLGNVEVEGGSTASYRARFAEIGLGLRKRALVFGRVEPRHIDLYESDLEISWSAAAFGDWAAQNLAGGGGPDADGASRNIIEIGPTADALRSLLAQPVEGEPLAFLQRVSLHSGVVAVIERESNAEWHLRDAHIDFRRAALGGQLTARMTLEAAGQTSNLVIETRQQEQGGRINIGLDEFNPALLARNVGLEGLFLTADLPVFGDIGVNIDNAGDIHSIDFDIGAGAGALNIAAVYPDRREFESVAALGRYEIADRQLHLESFRIEVGGGNLEGDGVIDFNDPSGKPDLKAFFTVADLPVDMVLRYWPARISPRTQEWISENVPEGYLESASFEIAMEPQMWGMRPVPASAVRIDFAFRDTTIHYLRPMPPLVKLNGRASFTSDALDAKIDGGEVDGIPVGESTYFLDKAGYRGQQYATARLRMEAGIRDFLRLVDYQPLNYTTRFNIPAELLSGKAFAVLDLQFPQRKGITVDDIKVNVEADITDGAMPSITRNGGLTEASVRMNLDKRGINASGRARLNGVGFNVYWTELFGPADDGQETTQYELIGELSPAELARFGVPAERFITGNVHAHVNLTGHRGVPLSGTGEIDFFGAGVMARKLVWNKPVNAPGSADFEFHWEDENFEIDRLELTAEGLTSVGRYSFSREEGELLSADVASLETEGHDLSLSMSLDEDGNYDIVVDARRVDARPFLDELLIASTGKMPPVRISLRADRALALNGVGLEDIRLETENSGEFWEWGQLDLTMTGGGTLSGTLERAGEKRQVSMTSDDAGRFARGAGFFLNGQGGRLEMLAEMNGKSESSYISGELLINDFDIVKSSRLVGAIVAKTGRDVDKFVDEQGLAFDKLKLPFYATDGVIDIPGAQANGPSIGFTLEGQVNRRSRQVNVNGSIVPVYALNSLIGKVPLVGGLLTGGEGGGLFALAYRVEGSMDEPEISVNPLSALAPGLLRKLFEGPKGKVDIEEEEQAAEPPPEG